MRVARGKSLAGLESGLNRDKNAKAFRQMRMEGESYGEIAEVLGRTKANIYRVSTALGASQH